MTARESQVMGTVLGNQKSRAAEDAIMYLATHPRERAEMASKTDEGVCQTFDIEKRMGELARVILS
jgi:hypothetical protein